jgi:hypothetical protein
MEEVCQPQLNFLYRQANHRIGLQCHTAPFTWKLTFELSKRLYEVIFSACSAAEEEAWTLHLRERISAENQDVSEGRSSIQDIFSSLSLDLKPIGTVFGQPEGVLRRLSIHRSPTTLPKSNPHQVIIKNTQAQKISPADSQSTLSLPVGRSQSDRSATNVPTLVPRRGDRVRLEVALADVWTRDVIPYPGMGVRRVENPIRASANSVMRKLSMASIASNFSRQSNYSKRSTSYHSLGPESTIQDPSRLESQPSKWSYGQRPPPPPAYKPPSMLSRPMQRQAPPILVDFHNTPTAFLPADFELDTVRSRSQRRLENRALIGIDQSSRKISVDDAFSTERVEPSSGLSVEDPDHRTGSMKTTSASVMLSAQKSHEMALEIDNGGNSSRCSSRATQTKADARCNSRIARPATPSSNRIIKMGTQQQKSLKYPEVSTDPQSNQPLPNKRGIKGRKKIFKFWS